MTPARREGYGVILTDHVFDKVRSIDMALAEFEELLGGGEVIEETAVADGVKELGPHHRVDAAAACGRRRG